MSDGARAVLALARILDREQLDPQTLVVRDPTLDDVFLTLTGRVPEPTDAERAS